jgi:hypothetical protein
MPPSNERTKEVTGAGRVWYCPDVEKRIVWLTLASIGHPKAKE